MKIPTENSPSEGEPVRTKPWLMFQKRSCAEYAVTSRGTYREFPAFYVATLSDGREFASIEPYLRSGGGTAWSISYHSPFNSIVVRSGFHEYKLAEAKEVVLAAYLCAEANIALLDTALGCPFCPSFPLLSKDLSGFTLFCSGGAKWPNTPHAQVSGATLAEVVAKWNTRYTEGAAKQ